MGRENSCARHTGTARLFRPFNHFLQRIMPDAIAPSELPTNGSQSETYDPAAFEAPDYYALDELLSDEARALRESVRTFVTREVLPVIEEHADAKTFPEQFVPKFAELGLLGPNLPREYGGGGHNNIVYGLMMQEIERGDSGLRSFCSVTGSLVMYPIWRYGSEAQKQAWLPKLAQAEAIGCFGLTEPDHGSNPAGMETRAERDGDDYILGERRD
jgi:glutaryl-CoA dehydrogenase